MIGSIALRIKETKEVYEGEVTELTPVETEGNKKQYFDFLFIFGGKNIKMLRYYRPINWKCWSW